VVDPKDQTVRRRAVRIRPGHEGGPLVVTDGLAPRLSGTLFACVIPGMMDFPPLVVARGNWGGRCFTLAPPEVR
jgi:hypothetical protein